MKVLRGLHELHLAPKSSVVTIGVFDGVHAGHVKVIRRAVARGRAAGLKSVVITFEPHPAKVLRRSSGVPSLISLDHRIRLIKALSPDYLVVLNFTKALAALTSEAFAKDILASHAGAKEAYVGDNFYFGKGAGAGPQELKKLGKRFGFKVAVVRSVKIDRKKISSSLIRKLITAGRLSEAAKFLARPVSVLGTVVSGANLARELGYPTANLNPHHEVIPPSGVYAVLVRHGKRLFKGVLNIGVRPTFYAPRDREPAIEVHIFGFRERIYGHDLEVFFLRKIRRERKFRTKEDLIRQIGQDERAALTVVRRTGIKEIKRVKIS
jgi:riboflavin kinase/FMN adenylyltransferase